MRRKTVIKCKAERTAERKIATRRKIATVTVIATDDSACAL
jgi:hypothetical protein